jgi:hypothetical protein
MGVWGMKNDRNDKRVAVDTLANTPPDGAGMGRRLFIFRTTAVLAGAVGVAAATASQAHTNRHHHNGEGGDVGFGHQDSVAHGGSDGTSHHHHHHGGGEGGDPGFGHQDSSMHGGSDGSHHHHSRPC